MYALKPPSKSNLQPVRPIRVSSHAKPSQRTYPYQAIAYETTAKLAVNIVISMASVVALVHLLPHLSSQEAKLQELQAAVKSTGERVQGVQSKFGNLFDPYQARENMQELTDRIDPMRRQVVLKDPVSTSFPKQSTEQGMLKE
ncbi:MAG: hypothetical protein HC866_14355 [Leptolyngbyaceae cyanobacterium RU_5_1]|nr:hypothetical protein [Leptolyngbyaceae cyanobacterium RU_5_1]